MRWYLGLPAFSIQQVCCGFMLLPYVCIQFLNVCFFVKFVLILLVFMVDLYDQNMIKSDGATLCFMCVFNFPCFFVPSLLLILFWMISPIRRCLGVGDLYSSWDSVDSWVEPQCPLITPTLCVYVYTIHIRVYTYTYSTVWSASRRWCMAPQTSPNSGLPWLPAQGDTAWAAIGTYVNTHKIINTWCFVRSIKRTVTDKTEHLQISGVASAHRQSLDQT